MKTEYTVYVYNQYDESINLTFRDYHHAIICYTNLRYDETVTYLTLEQIVYNDFNHVIGNLTLKVWEFGE